MIVDDAAAKGGDDTTKGDAAPTSDNKTPLIIGTVSAVAVMVGLGYYCYNRGNKDDKFEQPKRSGG